ncbi:hypothetical protein FUAX_42540 (plasmid) [Fulvitalea axinellae]|uniref:DUF3078 domain-containing protein n=1 Tax=Fulvitalea axinellae TaxID=1182444 RepID=A0AAU9CXV9_9BACT|nr:hypothetical protein FUAX_42540 [Fulvitalea axinellae]
MWVFLSPGLLYAQQDLLKYFPDTTISQVDTTRWSNRGSFSLSASSTGLSNWAAGGNSSISVVGNTVYGMRRESSKTIFLQQIDMAYGLVYLASTSFPIRKTSDHLINTTSFGLKVSPKLSFASLLVFQTQFDAGYKYSTDNGVDKRELISEFLSPTLVNISLGLQFINKKSFVTVISPVAGKLTIISNDSIASLGNYGVPKGSNFNGQLGPNIYLDLTKEFMENGKFKSSLNLFSEYEKIGKIDINWTYMFELKVNDWFSANFSGQLIYDDDINVTRDDETVGPALQLRYVLGLGIKKTF